MAQSVPMLPLAIMVACAGVVWLLRRVTLPGHFFQTTAWHLISSAISGLAGAIFQWAGNGSLSWPAFEMLVLGFALSYFTQDNPSATGAMRLQMQTQPTITDAPIGPKLQGGYARPPLLAFLMVAAATALAIATVGCGASQKQAWADIGNAIKANCMTLGDGLHALQDLVDLASQPGATAESVAIGLALRDGLDEAKCIFKQVVANGGGLFKGEKLAPGQQLALEAARWAEAHPTELEQKYGAARKK
jgi:hypothetical protein